MSDAIYLIDGSCSIRRPVNLKSWSTCKSVFTLDPKAESRYPFRMGLNGKVAIVTGASSGIGRATAIALAGQGVQQAVTARSADKLESLAKELPTESLVVPADMTNPQHIAQLVQSTVERFGRLDILLANAGIYIAGDVVAGDPDDWDRLIQTNVSGVFRLVRAALPHLIESGSGDVLVTSSISGHQAIQWEPVYSASKHAVQAFVHGLRRQLLQSGVRVGAVAPGMVLNELWGIDDPAEAERRASAGEGLRSKDVAEAIVFMLTRPRNVTIRDLVMLPRTQDL